jgi:hypothetical protein
VIAQLDLLAGLPVPPAEGTLEGAVARARDYVDARLASRVCVRCCDDRQLLFIHRQPNRWNVKVWTLVRAGASGARLREKIGKCDVVCRRCVLPQARHQMLRSSTSGSMRMVAKAATTTGSSENAVARGRAKRAAIAEDSKRVA